MERKEAEAKDDREILVDLLVGQAVLQERTENMGKMETDIADLKVKTETNGKDIGWIKKIGGGLFAIGVAGVGALKWWV